VNEDGSYTFGYEAADGSFKIETRDVAGNVKGMFGFVDEGGELKRVSYSASNGKCNCQFLIFQYDLNDL